MTNYSSRYASHIDELIHLPQQNTFPTRPHPNTSTQVHTWARRSPLPHALTSTASLSAARLLPLSGARSPSPWASRHALATALSRFVTGFCDAAGAGAPSMYGAAAALALPPALVDLRHDVAHGGLPPLRVLRVRVEQALGWLWEGFWAHVCAAAEERREGEEAGVVDEGEAAGWLCRMLEPRSPWQGVVEVVVRNERTRVVWVELLLRQATPAALRAAKALIKLCDRPFRDDWRPLCEAAAGVDAEDWSSEGESEDEGEADYMDESEDDDDDMEDVEESVKTPPRLRESGISHLHTKGDIKTSPRLELRRGGWKVDSSYPSISGENKLWADSKIGEVV